MIVLNENEGTLAPRFPHYGVGEALIDLPVHLPVTLAKVRPDESNMAQRPESFIGKSVVVAFLFFFGYPHPAQGVAWLVGRNLQAIVVVNGVPIGAAAAMGDPDAAACAHYGFYCGNQTACRCLQFDLSIYMIVNVRLAVRRHDDFRIWKFAGYNFAQCFCAPARVVGIEFGTAGTEAP